MLLIEGLIRYHFEVTPLVADKYYASSRTGNQLTCILNSLCESLLNLNGVFRESAVLTCFEHLQYLESKFTIPLFQTMFGKISAVSTRPAKKLGENDNKHV